MRDIEQPRVSGFELREEIGNVVKVVSRYGEVSVLATDLPIAQSFKTYGEWAQREIDFLLRLIQPRSTILDIGAHVGSHTLAFSRHVGEAGVVHAFEPQRPIFELLQQNVKANQLSNVIIHNTAVSDGQGEWAIKSLSYEDQNNFGAVGLHRIAKGEANVNRVPTMTVDDLALHECDLIKIDVEGMERTVLDGALETIHAHRPLVYFEANYIELAWDSVLALKNLDYRLFLHVVPAFNSNNFNQCKENFFGNAHETSLLGVPQERMDDLNSVLEQETTLTEVSTLDRLACLMLEAPRYGDPDLTALSPRQIARKNQFLESIVSERDEQLAALQRTVSERDEQVAALQRTVADRDEQVAALYRSRSWRVTKPLRGASILARRLVGSAIGLRPAHFVFRVFPLGQPRTHSLMGELSSNRSASPAEEGFHCFVDRAVINGGAVSVEGWAFHERKRISSVGILLDDGGFTQESPLSHGHQRADVSAAWPFANAYRSGFKGGANMPSSGEHTIALSFGMDDGEVIRLPISVAASEGQSMFGNVSRLLRAVNRRRVGIAVKSILRGDSRYVKDRIRAILQQPGAPPPIFDFAETMRFFHESEPDIRPLDQEIDIIIPVYNGIEFLRRLFKSILENTTSAYRLIIVDDCSTDEGIGPLIEHIMRDRPNTVLLRNSENKGFVVSVNRGCRHARNHLVLLNSDVEVPRHWLERLMRPILDDPTVASTTPFTNAATVCSFPTINEDNEIFADLSVDAVDLLFRRVKSEAIPIELPSGIGFCMGINRTVMEKIGAFDEETFRKGYGEENDWSMRASAVGYRNVMVPNLFVYHKHGGSFAQETKHALMQENLKKVVRRHPTYQQRVDEFIRRDPAAPLRRFLVFLLAGHQAVEKPTLIVDHDVGGGANTYRSQLIEERLGKGQAVLLLTYDRAWTSLKLQCFYKGYEAEFFVSDVDHVKTLPAHVPLGEIFYNNLVAFDSPLDVLVLLRTLKESTGATLTLAIHDFFPLCPSYNLLNDHGKFCDLPDLTECRRCLPGNAFGEPAAGSDIETWRGQWRSVFKIADTVLCFSENSRGLVDRVYPLRPGQAIVQPHTLNNHFTKRPKLDFSRDLNIGVVGAINFAKGSEIVIRLAKLLAENNPAAKLTVIGVLNDAPALKNLKVTGPYERSELPHLLERYNVNVCFLPSVCPETFSYVTEELINLHVPLCCFDLGAPAERVRQYDLGHVISEIDPVTASAEISQFFHKLRSAAET